MLFQVRFEHRRGVEDVSLDLSLADTLLHLRWGVGLHSVIVPFVSQTLIFFFPITCDESSKDALPLGACSLNVKHDNTFISKSTVVSAATIPPSILRSACVVRSSGMRLLLVVPSFSACGGDVGCAMYDTGISQDLFERRTVQSRAGGDPSAVFGTKVGVWPIRPPQCLLFPACPW